MLTSAAANAKQNLTDILSNQESFRNIHADVLDILALEPKLKIDFFNRM